MLKQLLDSFLQDRKINCCLNHWQGCDEVSNQNLVFKYKTCPFDSWNIIIHRYHTVVDIIMYLGTVKYQVSGQARPGLLVVPCHHCVINLIIPPCLYIITPCLHINSKFQGCSSNNASLDQTAGRCYWLARACKWYLAARTHFTSLSPEQTAEYEQHSYKHQTWPRMGLAGRRIEFIFSFRCVYCIDLLTRDVKAQRSWAEEQTKSNRLNKGNNPVWQQTVIALARGKCFNVITFIQDWWSWLYCCSPISSPDPIYNMNLVNINVGFMVFWSNTAIHFNV